MEEISDLEDRAKAVLYDIKETVEQLTWNLDIDGGSLLKAQAEDLMSILRDIRNLRKNNNKKG